MSAPASKIVASAPMGLAGPIGPIQVIPPGLTGLLQLKQQGRLPDKLSDLVAPVLELRDWYLTARRQDELSLFGAIPATALVATGGQGQAQFLVGGNPVVVPNTEIWYVEQIGMTWTQVVADLLRVAVSIGHGGGANAMPVTEDYADYTATRAKQGAVQATRGFWMFPGDGPRAFIYDISSVGIQFFLSMRATRCPI